MSRAHEVEATKSERNDINEHAGLPAERPARKKKQVRFQGESKLETVIKYNANTDQDAFSLINAKLGLSFRRKILHEATEISDEITNHPFWVSLTEAHLLAQISAAKECCVTQLHELEAIQEKITSISAQYQDGDCRKTPWSETVRHIENLHEKYREMIRSCDDIVSKPSAIAEHMQENSQEHASKLQTLRENTQHIVANTAAANHQLTETAKKLANVIPDTKDIAKRIAHNTWDFLKNNQALLFGAALVAVSAAILIFCPPAFLSVGVLVGFLGNVLLPMKKAMFGEVFSTPEKLTKASDGLRHTKAVLSDMPNKVSVVSKTSTLFSEKIKEVAHTPVIPRELGI